MFSRASAAPARSAVLALNIEDSFLMSRPVTFGMIVGNRGFFPDHLAKSGREEMIAAIKKAGHHVVAVGTEETK